MTTGTLTLTDFLLARIADDEAIGRAAIDERGWIADCGEEHDTALGAYPAQITGERVLAECDAKRRIVFICASALGPFDGDILDWPDMSAAENAALRRGRAQVIHSTMPRVLRLLALPYADHPDYRTEWRP